MRFFIILLALAALLGFLMHRFPYALSSDAQVSQAIYYILFLVMMSASLFARPDISLKQHGKYALGWFGIILVLMVGYSFRDELANSRLVGELLPSQARMTEQGEIVLYASDNGHFQLEAKVNGANILFLVDTGASGISLSYDDAMRAGIDVDALTYTIPHSTANGTSFSAGATIDRLGVAGLEFERLPVTISKEGRLNTSLLGMRFLKMMKSYRVEGNKLVLIP